MTISILSELATEPWRRGVQRLLASRVQHQLADELSAETAEELTAALRHEMEKAALRFAIDLADDDETQARWQSICRRAALRASVAA
jgi:hypothetical protein